MPGEFAVSSDLKDALSIEKSPMEDLSPMSMLSKILSKLEGMETALGLKENPDDDPGFDPESASSEGGFLG